MKLNETDWTRRLRRFAWRLCGGKFPTSTSPTLSDLCLRNPWMHVCSLQKHMLQHFGKPCLHAYIVCSPTHFRSNGDQKYFPDLFLRCSTADLHTAKLLRLLQETNRVSNNNLADILGVLRQIPKSSHLVAIEKNHTCGQLWNHHWTDFIERNNMKQRETTWSKTSKIIKSTMQNDALRCSLSHFRYSEAMFIKKSSWSTWLGILSAKPGSAAVQHRHRRDDVTLDVIFVWFGLVRYGFTETLNLISFEFFWYFLAGSMESIPLLTIAWKCAIQIPSWRTGMGWQCGNVAT